MMVCLWEMRVATVLVSRLHISSTDLRFLAQDVAATMPAVKVPCTQYFVFAVWSLGCSEADQSMM